MEGSGERERHREGGVGREKLGRARDQSKESYLWEFGFVTYIPILTKQSESSLGHCGNITPDWGFMCADKACHYHLWIHC